MNVSNTRRIEMLAHGRIGPTLFKLSAPAIVGMLVMAVYNVVDTFFVSLLRDTTAVAATGIVFPIFQLVAAIGLTFGMGAASVISRRLGRAIMRAVSISEKKEPWSPSGRVIIIPPHTPTGTSWCWGCPPLCGRFWGAFLSESSTTLREAMEIQPLPP